MKDPVFTPADVVLGMPPFVGCFKHSEAEQAAALITLVCQKRGAWGDIEPQACGELLQEAQSDEKAHPLLRYPFLRPDAWALVKDGFAEWATEPGKSIRFTDAGFEAMRRWVLTKPSVDSSKES